MSEKKDETMFPSLKNIKQTGVQLNNRIVSVNGSSWEGKKETWLSGWVERQSGSIKGQKKKAVSYLKGLGK